MGDKLNCWEYMHCGREPGGNKVEELGVCSSAVSDEFTGINDGSAAGRCCWGVAGTLCNGQVQGTSAQKIGNCFTCRFYQEVQRQEGSSFKGITFMNRLNRDK